MSALKAVHCARLRICVAAIDLFSNNPNRNQWMSCAMRTVKKINWRVLFFLFLNDKHKHGPCITHNVIERTNFISTKKILFVENLFVRLFCAEKNGIELKTREGPLSFEIEPYIFIIMHSVIAFGVLTRAKMPTLSFVQSNQKNIFSMLLRFDIRHSTTTHWQSLYFFTGIYFSIERNFFRRLPLE